jgi:hypothetical protein
MFLTSVTRCQAGGCGTSRGGSDDIDDDLRCSAAAGLGRPRGDGHRGRAGRRRQRRITVQACQARSRGPAGQRHSSDASIMVRAAQDGGSAAAADWVMSCQAETSSLLPPRRRRGRLVLSLSRPRSPFADDADRRTMTQRAHMVKTA